MATHSPSGERQHGPRQVVRPSRTAMPLAGRSSYEDRLRIWREGHGPKPDVAPFIGFEAATPYPEKIERFERPVVSSSLQACVACALSGALSASIIAIFLFWITRPAAAMTPAMLPREPMQQDVVFGLVAFGILVVIAGGLALFVIWSEKRDRKEAPGKFDPAELNDQRRGPRFGEDDRYA